jgi:hypothetical protein
MLAVLQHLLHQHLRHLLVHLIDPVAQVVLDQGLTERQKLLHGVVHSHQDPAVRVALEQGLTEQQKLLHVERHLVGKARLQKLHKLQKLRVKALAL